MKRAHLLVSFASAAMLLLSGLQKSSDTPDVTPEPSAPYNYRVTECEKARASEEPTNVTSVTMVAGGFLAAGSAAMVGVATGVGAIGGLLAIPAFFAGMVAGEDVGHGIGHYRSRRDCPGVAARVIAKTEAPRYKKDAGLTIYGINEDRFSVYEFPAGMEIEDVLKQSPLLTVDSKTNQITILGRKTFVSKEITNKASLAATELRTRGNYAPMYELLRNLGAYRPAPPQKVIQSAVKNHD